MYRWQKGNGKYKYLRVGQAGRQSIPQWHSSLKRLGRGGGPLFHSSVPAACLLGGSLCVSLLLICGNVKS